MAHDVFISHSNKDKAVADAACAWLERHGIRCWIAPRDIVPGAEWGAAIVQAIRGARVMVVIFSSHANASKQIMREVERAVNAGVTLIPVRIEDVVPRDSLDYFFSSSHWLDAFTPPMEQHFDQLAAAIREALKLTSPRPEPVRPAQKSRVPWIAAASILAAVMAGSLGWYFGVGQGHPAVAIGASTAAPAVAAGKNVSATNQEAVTDIPAADVARVIQPAAQIDVRHLVGLPGAMLQVTFHNPYGATLTLSHLSLAFTGPGGSSFTLPPQAVILNNVPMPPVDGGVFSPGQTITYTFAFGTLTPELQLLANRVNAELTTAPGSALLQDEASGRVPDPRAQILSAGITGDLIAFMNRQFPWKAGSWTLEIRCTYGDGRLLVEPRHFNLAESDIAAMKAITKYYASGIGVMNAWCYLAILDGRPEKIADLNP